MDWLCGLIKLPALLKGIVHPDEVRPAVEHRTGGDRQQLRQPLSHCFG